MCFICCKGRHGVQLVLCVLCVLGELLFLVCMRVCVCVGGGGISGVDVYLFWASRV